MFFLGKTIICNNDAKFSAKSWQNERQNMKLQSNSNKNRKKNTTDVLCCVSNADSLSSAATAAGLPIRFVTFQAAIANANTSPNG